MTPLDLNPDPSYLTKSQRISETKVQHYLIFKDLLHFTTYSIFCNGYKNVQVDSGSGSGAVINWPSGSGSKRNIYGSTTPLLSVTSESLDLSPQLGQYGTSMETSLSP
jgi:hypothetical protein